MLDLSFNPGRTRAALVFTHPSGNILTADLIAQLRAAIPDLSALPHLKLVTIEGAGPDFSFGASIPEHAPGAIERVLPDTHAFIVDLLDLPVVTAAVVRGRCLGGGFELALACDFIFAEERAVFGLPEIALGVFPPAATVLLPRRVGAARATSAVLTGDARPALAWQAFGLVEVVTPADRLRSAIDDWFDRTLAPRSAEALRHAVRAVRRPLRDAVARELPIVERLYLQDLMRSADAVEGIRAFAEKRAPDWKDA
jgi:cyclohexa-1,5-dienecarbonyl-CoA hydratase